MITEYYTETSKETISIRHRDNTITSRPVKVEGMRVHDELTLRLLTSDPKKIWSIDELRKLEGD